MSSVMPDVDHAVVGAGLSGLLLTRALLHNRAQGVSGRRPRVLLVDPRSRDDGPMTLAFWTTGPTTLDRWTIRTWDALAVVDPTGRTHRLTLDAWRYTAVDWSRARDDLLAELGADPRVTVVPEPVTAIRDGAQAAAVRAGDEWMSASWVYDSRPPTLIEAQRGVRQQARRSGVVLAQAFRGAWVRTDQHTVDTTAATLLDFSADDGDDLEFAYALPTSPRTALVMAVRMAGVDTLPDPAPAIPRVAGSTTWQIEAGEQGVTPLVLPSPPRRRGRRVLAIGARGGRVRPSTGYAVMRVLDDSTAIGSSLDRYGHPFAVPADPPWQRTLDLIWLRALRNERAGFERAFHSLFTHAPVDSVLRFLDGDTRWLDVARVVTALPPGPFLRALVPSLASAGQRDA